MLSFASDFWPLFWTIIGSGAALTVLSSIGVATFQQSWLRPSRSRRHELAIVHHLLAAGPQGGMRLLPVSPSFGLDRLDLRTSVPSACPDGPSGRVAAHLASAQAQVKRRETQVPGIIAGVDGSGHSQRALEWAAREAAARHLPLVVITVYQAVAGAWGSAIAYPDDPVLAEHAQKAAQEKAQEQVDEALARSGGSHPGSVTIRAVSGNPAEELFSAAEDAGMIVVGSRGTGGFARLPLGSVASHLAHHAHCPVVIIPAEDRN